MCPSLLIFLKDESHALVLRRDFGKRFYLAGAPARGARIGKPLAWGQWSFARNHRARITKWLALVFPSTHLHS